MLTRDFHYELPEALIAQRPLARRTASRLLTLDGETGALRDGTFRDLPELLRPGDLLVFNDTRVIPARLHGQKDSGGRVELLVERLLGGRRLLAHVRASRSPRPGSRLHLEGGLEALVTDRREALFEIELAGERPVLELLEAHGHVPLPPYIQRPDEVQDTERYQTVYARRPGAVAAPTAGLHFDAGLLEQLESRGVASTFVTLHVGAGTFQPVRAERAEDHPMHAEVVEVGEAACDAIRAARRRGGRVVAVGTTVVRSLESAVGGEGLRPFQGETRLFIRPGYRFRCVDALITNFHLPGSTLLMLVAAFAGHAHVMAAYRHAVEHRYRFFSYGDAMFLTPNPAAAQASADHPDTGSS